MTAAHPVVGTGYTPGGWLAMAGPDLWLLAGAAPGDPVVRDCWPLVRAGADLTELTLALKAAGAPPSFAVAHHRAGGVRVVVCGAAWAEIVGVDGHVTALRADPGTGTAEAELDRPVAAVRLGGGAAALADAADPLPLDSGVVLAAALTTHLAPLAEHRPEAVAPPAPVATLPEAPAEPDGPEEDPTRFFAMMGLTTPAPARTEEFAEPPPAPAPYLEPRQEQPQEPIGLTTVRPNESGPAGRGATTDDVIDLDDLDWLVTPLPPAPPQAAAAQLAQTPPLPPPPPLIQTPPLPARPPMAVQPPPVQLPAVRPPTAQPQAWPTPAVAAPEAEEDDALIFTTVRAARGGPGQAPTVSAVRCPAGHLNDPAARDCRVCGQPLLVQSPVRVTRPPLGVLRLSTGDTILLDRDVLLGRAPGTPSGSGADEPHYVKLTSPYNDISRRHVEVRLDGWDVIAVDLDSRNGAFVEQPGEPPAELPRGGGQVLRPGAVVGLTEDVSFRFEVSG